MQQTHSLKNHFISMVLYANHNAAGLTEEQRNKRKCPADAGHFQKAASSLNYRLIAVM